MPIYEYSCNDCGHEFEHLVRANDEPGKCPACGKHHLTKSFSVPAAHTGSTAPACPARESCGAPKCCGGQCGMADFMG